MPINFRLECKRSFPFVVLYFYLFSGNLKLMLSFVWTTSEDYIRWESGLIQNTDHYEFCCLISLAARLMISMASFKSGSSDEGMNSISSSICSQPYLFLFRPSLFLLKAPSVPSTILLFLVASHFPTQTNHWLESDLPASF